MTTWVYKRIFFLLKRSHFICNQIISAHDAIEIISYMYKIRNYKNIKSIFQ